jgi:hypothetical protein
MNYNINLNLKALKNTLIYKIKTKEGIIKPCLIIPIDENDLYVGEKGIYLNLTSWEAKNLRDGKTHLIKQSFSKNARAAMTDDEFKNQPLMGDAKPFEKTAAPIQSEGELDLTEPEADDLPF